MAKSSVACNWCLFTLVQGWIIGSAFAMSGSECTAVADGFNKHDRPWFLERSRAGSEFSNYWAVCILQDGVYKLRKEYTWSAEATEIAQALEAKGSVQALIAGYIDAFKNDYCVKWQRGAKTGEFVWAGEPYVYVLKKIDGVTFRTFEMNIDSCSGLFQR
jgi:hypothetical protein